MVLLVAAMKVVPVSCMVIYTGICTIGTAVMNKKEGLHMNPIDIILGK